MTLIRLGENLPWSVSATLAAPMTIEPTTMLVPRSIWLAVHTLATGGAIWPPASPEDGRAFVEEARINGLLPLLLAEANASPQTMPAVVHAALGEVAAARFVYRKRHEIFERKMARVAAIAADEPFIVLKGSDYRFRLYRSPELRPSLDIDLLVPLARAEPMARRFIAAGYSRFFSQGARGYLRDYPEIIFDVDGTLIEIHTAVNYRLRAAIDYDAVWSRRVPFRGAFRLAHGDAFLFHAVNMAKDEFSAPLIRYVDAWLMLRDAAMVEKAVEQARSWRVERALYGMLRLCASLLPDSAEGSAAVRGAEELLRPRTRRFLARTVLPDPRRERAGHRQGRFIQLWRKFWLIDLAWRRAAYLGYHAYASMAAGWIALRDPRRRGPHVVDASGQVQTRPEGE